MALKDAAYQEALLTKRIEFVQRLKADLAVTNSIAAQTVACYTELVDGASEQWLQHYLLLFDERSITVTPNISFT